MPSDPEVASEQEDGDIAESIVPSDPEVGSQQEDGDIAQRILMVQVHHSEVNLRLLRNKKRLLLLRSEL